MVLQGGTVVERVEGEVEIADTDDKGNPLRGPVLVLSDIEKGSKLTLAHPRAVTVLGSLSGQVFGAYHVKTGNLLSGRLEGARQVEVIHSMGSLGKSNEDSWIVFEATSDPGFFAQAQGGLERLRELEKHQLPQREAQARQILLAALRKVSFKVEISVMVDGEPRRVLAVHPERASGQVMFEGAKLMTHVFSKIDRGHTSPEQTVQAFQEALKETITTSLKEASKGGMGSAMRRQQGDEMYEPYVEAVYDYVLPKLMKLWHRTSEAFVQRVVDRLADAPMILRVRGQLAPFFQIEYPRWKFHVTGGRIVPEKTADCNIACQAGSKPELLSMTYTYIAENGEFLTNVHEIERAKTKDCRLLLKNGAVCLTEESNCLFSPDGTGSGQKES